MQLALSRTLVGPALLSRTSSRAARVGAFAVETWSRLLLDGAPMGAEERARELSWVAENLCALHGVRTEVHGSAPRGPAVLVANHVSYFDPLIIASAVPCSAIAKREVLSWPCIGELCRRLGVLFVRRGDPSSGARVLREALRLLDAGVSVLVFPEGTTTRGGSVLPFKAGAFGAALLADVPVVPIALRYEGSHAPWAGDDTFLPHYMRAMTKPYTRAVVEFLEPLSSTGAASVSALAVHARAAIDASLARGDARHRRVSPFLDGFSAVSA